MKKSEINTRAVVRHQARDTILSEVQSKNKQVGTEKEEKENRQ